VLLAVVGVAETDARWRWQSQGSDGEQLQINPASESANFTHQHQLSQRGQFNALQLSFVL